MANKLKDIWQRIKGMFNRNKRLVEGNQHINYENKIEKGENIQMSTSTETKENEFKKQIRESAVVDKLDPKNYKTPNEMYIGILENMGLSEEFKKYPNAIQDLSDTVKEMIENDEILKEKNNVYTRDDLRQIQDMLKSSGIFEFNGNEVIITKNQDKYIPENQYASKQRSKTTLKIDENKNYTNENMDYEIFARTADGLNFEGDGMSLSGYKRVYNQRGIELSEEFVSRSDNSTKGKQMYNKELKDELFKMSGYPGAFEFDTVKQQKVNEYSRYARENVNQVVCSERKFIDGRIETCGIRAVNGSRDIAGIVVPQEVLSALKERDRDQIEKYEEDYKQILSDKSLLESQIKNSSKKEALTQMAVEENILEPQEELGEK